MDRRDAAEATRYALQTFDAAKRREAKGAAPVSDTLQANAAYAKARLAEQRAAGDYHKAVERERATWREAEAAAEALRSLRLEAAAAITRVGAGQPVADEHWWAEQWTTAELPAAA